VEIDTSRQTQQHTRERVELPDTTSVARLENTAASIPLSKTVASQPAVETSLLSHLPAKSRDEEIARILTQVLTTLLEHLDGVAELTLPEVTEYLDEVIRNAGGGSFQDDNNSEVDRTLTARRLFPTFIPSPSSTSPDEAPSPSRSPSGFLRNPDVSLPNTLTEAPPHKSNTTHVRNGTSTGDILSKSDTRPLMNVSSTDTSKEPAKVPNNSPNIASKHTVRFPQDTLDYRSNLGNPGGKFPQDGSPYRTDTTTEMRLTDELIGSKLQRQGTQTGGLTQTQSTTLFLPPKKSLGAEYSLIQTPQPRTPLRIDSSTISTYRDLIRSLLSQPGGGTNQLEAGVAKALASALSNETTSRLLELLTKTNLIPKQDRLNELSLTPEQIKSPSASPEYWKKGAEQPSRAESKGGPSVQTSIVRSGEESLIQLTHSTSSRELIGSSANHGSPLGFTLKGLVGLHPNTLRAHVGVLSDPALLAALQGAALKRTYTDIPKRRKRVSENRRLNDWHREKDENLNDSSQESTGLSLLRAFLERRTEISRR
jgi:hypothetical protein